MKQSKKGLIRFQSIDERSFNIHRLPIVCGSEDATTWPSLRQETEDDNLANGHAVITQNSGGVGADWRLAFTKETSVVSKHHFVVSEISVAGNDSAQVMIEPLEPIMLNRRLLTGGVHQLKQNDQITFPGDKNALPHCYHVQLPGASDEMEFNFDVLRPLVQKCDPRLQIYIDLVQQQKPEDLKYAVDWWSREEMRQFKFYLLSFGYGRWSKIRAVSAQSDKLLEKKRDSQMRPYANMLLLLLSQCTESLPKLQRNLLGLVEVNDRDIKVNLSCVDFMGNGKTVAYFKQNAAQWAKRILALSRMTALVREFKAVQKEKPEKQLGLLNFVSARELAEVDKPARAGIHGGIWSRAQDTDLILKVYESGSKHLPADQMFRIQSIMQIVASKPPAFDFETKAKEITGFSYEQKVKIFQILTTFGIPINPADDTKEDWLLLRSLLDKQVFGDINQLPVEEQLSQLEKFVTQLDVVASKILKDYSEPIKQTLSKMAESQHSRSSSSSSSSQDTCEEAKSNDFHIDKGRLKAALNFEKKSGKWTRFDPDGDGFDFGYEMALTYKIRVNMIKIIRKEICAANFRLWEQCLENTKEKLGADDSIRESQLPAHWKCEVHDRNLLKAVSENGLTFLGKLKDNREYEFGGMMVKRKILLRRLEKLCFHFKQLLPKFKKLNDKLNGMRSGDKTTGQTKIDLKKKFTRVNVERDLEGNIVYPIIITPTLQILNLGSVEWQRPAYHSEKNIFPIGFKSLRKNTSMVHLGKQDEYICEILDGGVKPMFKVTCSAEPNKPIIQSSSSGVWIEICRRINELQGGQRQKVTVSGPDRYGLAEPGVGQLISCLPDAEKCQRFKPPQ